MLEALKTAQRSALEAGEFSNLDPHYNELVNFYNGTSELIKTLDYQKKNSVLRPADISLLVALESRLNVIEKQSEMYIQELEHIKDPSSRRDLVCLIIESQPFPKSVKQNKPLKESLTLKLLTGVMTQCIPLSSVNASVITEFSSRSKNPITVANNTASVSNNNQVVFNVSSTVFFLRSRHLQAF